MKSKRFPSYFGICGQWRLLYVDSFLLFAQFCSLSLLSRITKFWKANKWFSFSKIIKLVFLWYTRPGFLWDRLSRAVCSLFDASCRLTLNHGSLPFNIELWMIIWDNDVRLTKSFKYKEPSVLSAQIKIFTLEINSWLSIIAVETKRLSFHVNVLGFSLRSVLDGIKKVIYSIKS